MSEKTKTYLGDGTFAEYDGQGIILTIGDGIRVEMEIYLLSHVVDSLLRFIELLKKPRK